ncbi:putative mitochondrial nuclear cap binding complex subunit CBP30 (CBP30) [Leptomonas pyrrhocoris]|uniref:Putative mitochondrial nuclear cap binding complex subunit CBP30 (CBP30) n=1 Tax=Leptomonas pyrrhocoris TaxID=157538 RepID=A0A0M9G594_LEPPY|nr:putative mitochondrial nuclear cap binding complex subunit CBP30 (CBP30) [Leptomonas pyrrhocoris]XP_015661109.1 putative mitochondrial nuclear cap binding complex subunit CBP30 (CBP30) [Leptomonas pyrrhocoris]KPA82669.1 putative mitochondrial nuclear cap binding complex subunit CBP30 (CBP30) [Leptomonas pyrrhocoris]KPA82670.1 putative mitochondrial nuclear cap binding complex subunit CBP30 (CBP30) [Leptomonas pyrrhocoris]|eukprot:XP_015661108.1 putative mitochondrial nuclear cap binding complex subunit CBP30 (CBP30) [Leptomonas pyrrhocoris]
MSGGDQNGTRGTGFVHLNTPASIHYTTGQTLSLSALRQRKSRVECVVLPESVAVWRRAFQRYVKEEGYSSYAADVEDERAGSGVVLPPLVPQRSGPERRRAQDGVSATDAFFCSPTSCGAAEAAKKASTAAASATSSANDAAAPVQAAATVSSSGSADASSSSSSSASPLALQPAKGITIVSHHKVAGRQQFVYPDYDGVLSAGVVPQVIVTEEEKAEEEAAKAFYISALDMTEEELAALEELQALWKSRARSHSFLGAQHRNAAKGSTDPSTPEEEEHVSSGSRQHASREDRPLKSRRVDGGHETVEDIAYAEAETAVDDASTLDKELAEALRLADDLLRFA